MPQLEVLRPPHCLHKQELLGILLGYQMHISVSQAHSWQSRPHLCWTDDEGRPLEDTTHYHASQPDG